jgi:NADPH2:quinone reductase
MKALVSRAYGQLEELVLANLPKPGGQLISPLAGPPAFDREVSATYAGTTTPEGRLAEFAVQAADGRLRVEIGASYPFTQAREALVAFATRHVRGKVTVTF